MFNSWFTVKVKYTKQLDDGTFKRVSEPYLLAAMTFTDAEARIYEELGALVRGEFIVTHISREAVHDIFHYEDSDVWYKCTIKFENGDGGEEGGRAKKVTQIFLVSAHSVKEAYERLQESLGGMLIDFGIPKIVQSPIVDIFPFGDDGEDRVAVEFEKQVKREVGEHLRASISGGDLIMRNSSIDNVGKLLPDAARHVVEKGKASVEILQRKFKLGEIGATVLMDTLEAAGIVDRTADPEGELPGYEIRVNFDSVEALEKYLQRQEHVTG